MKKTLVLGATTNPSKYGYIATSRLKSYGHEVVPVGIREGKIGGIEIRNDLPILDDIDTITLYLNPTVQKNYYDYILKINPKRIIFNPGTENIELVNLAKQNGIEVEIACTLVLLSVDQY